MLVRPVIGLVGRWDEQKQEYSVSQESLRAVEAAGGVPELIPFDPAGGEDLATRMDRMDGFLLGGNASDLDPARYGETRHPQVKTIHPRRDETDWQVIEHAFRTRKPVLGICFGMQSLNVYCDGTLVQHIAAQVPGALEHEGRGAEHAIELEAGSRLAGWAGGRRELLVNSTHHQAPDRIGKGLRVAARAPDGVIEAIEDAEIESNSPGHFLIGVEWHPERIWETEPLSARLFVELVRAAAGKAAGSGMTVRTHSVVETSQ